MNSKQIKALTIWLINKTRRLDKSTVWGDIDVILLDDEQITEINQQVFNKTSPTDVISLRYNPLPGIDNSTTGEIFVNIQRAIQTTTTSNGWNPTKEFALYLAHGCDHLAGSCDDTEKEYKTMRRRELRWLRMAAELGLVQELFSGN